MAHRISEERHQKLVKEEARERRFDKAARQYNEAMGYCPPSQETIDKKLTGDMENTMAIANRTMRIAECLDGKSEEYRDGFLDGMIKASEWGTK